MVQTRIVLSVTLCFARQAFSTRLFCVSSSSTPTCMALADYPIGLDETALGLFLSSAKSIASIDDRYFISTSSHHSSI